MATAINNYATASYAYAGRVGQESAISNTATTNLISEYAISASKDALNNAFRAGENITYYIRVQNDGTSPLYNVTVSDDLGGSSNPLSYITGTAILNINGEISAITPTTLSPLTFVIPGALAADTTATITYVAQVSSGILSTVTEITNTATVQANEGSAGGTVINVTPNPTNTLTLENFASLTMTKAVSTNEININEPFSYTITLSNSGNLDATNVVITDTLPTNFTVSSITSQSGGTQTTFTSSEYTIDPTTNTLTLPNGTGTNSITVPAATVSGDGTTIVTINGTITQ